jgi:putative FmdB family regulatory protein
MPIYAYKCASCGHSKDVLQKISDPQLTVCPECGAASFTKQVTAAGFQLKGSGWYATDFRGGGSSAPAVEAKTDSKAETKTESKTDSKPSDSAAPATTKTSTTPSASAGGCGSSCACPKP